MSAAKIRIPLSEHQERFVYSAAPIVALIGPQGEGKTYAGFAGMFYHQARLGGRTVRCAIIRDTHQNIKTMTVPSIREAIAFIAERNDNPQFARDFTFSDGMKKFVGPGIDCDLFGIDELGDLTKLQGGEYSLIWLEEPAPMFERANAGLSEEVFTGALSRVARQRGAVPRLQITMNPADEDHWTHKRLILSPIMRPADMPDIWTETVQIPYGANTFLNDLQRQTAKAAFKDNPALWQRYVEGRFAFVPTGEQVTPEYNEQTHRATGKLPVFPNARGIRFWDGGHNPTCIIAQINPVTGRLQVFHTFVGQNIGTQQLIRIYVRPALEERFKSVTQWFDTGDPSLKTADDSNIEVSPAKVIEQELKTTYTPGVKEWDTRVQAVKYVLTNLPLLLLEPGEELLHKALRGGWHYAKTADGKIIRDAAVKNLSSHPGDALGQGLPRIIGTDALHIAVPKKKKKEPESWLEAG